MSFLSKNIPPKDENSIIKLLVIGGTGQGKSTLVNYILSFALHKSFEDPPVAIPSKFYPIPYVEGYQSSGEDSPDSATSKTKRCNSYDVFVGDQIRKWFRLIDTPGINDTNGDDLYDANQIEIYRGVVAAQTLSAIVVVVNGTNPRGTSDINALLTRLQDVLTDTTFGNLMFVVTCWNTHSDFDLNSLKPLLPCTRRTFYMNNSAHSFDPASMTEVSRAERMNLQNEWRMSMHWIYKLLSVVAGMSISSNICFQRARDVVNDLKGRISRASVEVFEMLQLADDLECLQLANYLPCEAIEAIAQNYTCEESNQIDEIVFKKTEYKSTCCNLHTGVVCHRHCYLDYAPNANSNVFAHCDCMGCGSTNSCKVCRCSAINHFHSFELPIRTKTTVKERWKKIVALYAAKLDEAEDLAFDLSSRANKLALLEAAIKQKRADVEAMLIELRRVCSGWTLATELRGTAEKMKQDKKSLQSEAAMKSADEFIKVITQFAENCRNL